MSSHRPIWFDIDGTLLHTRAGHAAFREALREVYGWEESLADVRFAGNTDLRVLMEMSARHAGDPEAALPRRREFFARMTVHLDHGLARDRPEVVAGAAELVARLAEREEVGLYLLTGNARECAFCKLRHIDLHHWFVEGGFGDEHADRDVLAVRSRERITARFGDREVHAGWVIGDTPRDIRAAHVIGARAVGVATLAYSADDLRTAGADVVVSHLAEAGALVERLLA